MGDSGVSSALMGRRAFLKEAGAIAIAAITPRLGLAADARAQGCPQQAGTARRLQVRSLADFRKAGRDLRMTAVQGLDLSGFDARFWRDAQVEGSYFLGCRFANPGTAAMLQRKGAVILPPFTELPYDPYRTTLYTLADLERRQPSGITFDEAVYCDFVAKGRFSPGVIEALARRIHDNSIDDALERFVREQGEDRFVGIMGGADVPRSDPWYRKTAETAYLLAKSGKIVMSGGGSGMMEAANLGAYLSAYDSSAVNEALRILSAAPEKQDAGWNGSTLEVKDKFPKGAENLAITTWYFGAESINPFANPIARYFDVSIREAQLIHNSRSGIVFAPGSAGTREEVFMDAERSHYSRSGFRNVMVFLGKSQYERDLPVFPILRKMANSKDLLFITDEPGEAARFIIEHSPRPDH